MPPAIFALAIMSLVLVGTFILAGTLPIAATNCLANGQKAVWRPGSSVAVSLPGWNGLSFQDGLAVKLAIEDWRSVAESSGAFFYAPIDGDLIRRTNRDLIAATDPGA